LFPGSSCSCHSCCWCYRSYYRCIRLHPRRVRILRPPARPSRGQPQGSTDLTQLAALRVRLRNVSPDAVLERLKGRAAWEIAEMKHLTDLWTVVLLGSLAAAYGQTAGNIYQATLGE